MGLVDTTYFRPEDTTMPAMKTLCPISRGEFNQHAKPITVVIDGRTHIAAPKQFSTGSMGWNINGKMTVEINGKHVEVQIGLNLTLVNSKDVPA
jgi:hypothetical protein